jgi:hypothetical protein
VIFMSWFVLLGALLTRNLYAPPAIHLQIDSRYKFRFLGGQKQAGIRDIIDLSNPPHRHIARKFGAILWRILQARERRKQPRSGNQRAHTYHTDAVRTVLSSEPFRGLWLSDEVHTIWVKDEGGCIR